MRVKQDNLYFLEKYVITNHNDGNPPGPARFPSVKERPDLYRLAERWNEEQILVVEKASQMTITWLFVSLYLHRTFTRQGQLNFLQSKKEKDAEKLLAKALFIYHRLPKFLKAGNPCEANLSEMRLPQIDSLLWAIPQGGDQIRSYTANGVFIDEAAFQPEFYDAYAASRARIGKHGKLTIVSTPNKFKEFFYVLAQDADRVT